MNGSAYELRLAAANDREACRAQLARNREDARDLFQGRTDAQLLWRPSPEAWSIAECFLHLNRTGQVYLGAIDRAIERGRRAGRTGEGPYRHSWFGRWFVGSLEPPARHRFKAPALFAPPPLVGSPSALLDAFVALGGEIGERLDASRGLDLGRIPVMSPVVPLLRISLGMAFSLLPTHERRHLVQARAVAARPDFPRAS